jgi:hypothetical protein
MKRIFPILTPVLLMQLAISPAYAATGNTSRTLTKGQNVTINPNGCSLRIASQNTSKVVVRCIAPAVKASGKSTITLKKGKRAVITAKSCFLGVTTNSSKRVALRCLATRPTATPTTTATATVTQTATATATPTATATLTPNAQALTSNNELLSFNTSAPASSASITSISNITSGETLVSIDRRPQNGMLYGLGYNPTTGSVQLYLLSVRSGFATAVGTTGSFVDSVGNPVRIGVDALSKIGIDFNPSADRLRVVTTNGQNLRINPNTGAFVDGDTVETGLNTDGAINTGTTTVGETAYTSNQPGATFTTQYTIDSVTNSLFIQNPPNAGTQTSPLALTSGGAALDIVEVRGFDIPEGVSASSSNAAVSTGSGFAILEFASNSQQRFCQVDLASAAVSNSSLIDDGTDSLLGLAVQNAESPPMIALAAGTNQVLRFRANSPGTVTTLSVTGLAASETLVGVDFRPATGELMGLGINATADTGTLYTIDPQTGAAAAIGTTSSIAFVDEGGNPRDFLDPASAAYGVNFNPTVDRIRVVSSSGLNFRINPNTGAPVDGNNGGSSVSGINTDGDINSGTSGVNGTSYTNSFAGPLSGGVTTNYTLDAVTDSLFIQNPPNSGTQINKIALTLGGNPLDFATALAFEIPPSVSVATSNTTVSSGSAFAALSVGGVTSLYSINLGTGAATNLGAIGSGSTPIMGLAVGEVEAR